MAETSPTKRTKRSQIKLPDDFVREYAGRQPNWGPLGWITYKRTYARVLDRRTGQREEWPETVRRVVEGNLSMDPRPRTPEVVQELTDEGREMFDMIFRLGWLPPGRGLWISGTERLRKLGDTAFNCWAIAVRPDIYEGEDHARASFPFVFAFNELMCGGGVGFSVTQEHVTEFAPVRNPVVLHIVCDPHHPNIRELNAGPIPQTSNVTVRVEDSREGWCEALRVLIDAHWKANRERNIVVDVSDVRAAGEPIRGFGGTAAGPGPLVNLLRAANGILNDRVGTNLTPVDCTDMMNQIGKAVVAGNVRRCLPEGTIVHTERGGVPIEKVRPGDRVVVAGESHEVTDHLVQGEQETVLVGHAFGTFECTANHLMAVICDLDGTLAWKRAGDLRAGDRLAWDAIGYDGTEQSLPEAAEHMRAVHDTVGQTVTVPALDTDVAWLIGLIHGDGHVHVPRDDVKTPSGFVQIACDETHTDLIERAGRTLERFGARVHLKHQDGERCVKICAYSTRLAEYMLANIKQPNTPSTVPAFIRDAPRDIRGAYLAGVFDANGYNDPIRGDACVLAATIYPSFAADLVSLCASLGIPAVQRLSRPARGNWKDLHHVCPTGVCSYRGLAEHVNPHISAKPPLAVPSRDSGGFSYSMSWVIERHGTPKGAWCRSCSQVSVDRLESQTDHVRGGMLPVPVTGVMPSGRTVATYDITVADAHRFTAEGLVVHNSAELALGSSDDLAFIGMKLDQDKLMSHRWASNNSIAIDSEFEDFERIAAAIVANGEPGIVNLDLQRTRGRLADEGPSDERNRAIIGTNPCFPADQRVLVYDSEREESRYASFGELAATGGPVIVETDGRMPGNEGQGDLVLRQASPVRMTRADAELVQVITGSGARVRCTPDHEFFLDDGSRRAARDLLGARVRMALGSVAEVISVEPSGREDVYCLTEPVTGSIVVEEFVVSNCGEIGLASGEACCLAEVFPAICMDEDIDVERALRLALRYAKRVTFADLSWQISRDIMARNHRVGVSLSGIRDWMLKLGVREGEELAPLLDHYYGIVRDEDERYSAALGCPSSVAVTTVKPSGCRPWNALTSTSDGLLTIEELLADHPPGEQWADAPAGMMALQGDTTSAITKTYDNGVADIVRVKTDYGLDLECTPNHRWWVMRGHEGPGRGEDVGEWREAQNLSAGDVIEVSPGAYASNLSARLTSVSSVAFSMRADAKEITQPERMTADLAWLIGYLWGDGSMSPGGFRLRLTDGRQDNLEKARRIISEQFSVDATLRPASEGRKASTLEFGSKHLWHWLIRNGVVKDHAGKSGLIPEVVRRSAHEHILAFLAGLIDADGRIAAREKDNLAIITTSDGAFAEHIQHVALAVGLVFSRSHATGGQSFQKRRSMWHLTLMPETLKERFDIVRAHSVKMRPHNMRRPERPWTHERPRARVAHTPGKVISVESAGQSKTYDIEVANTHWYYAGAVKSHNTISLLSNASPGLHAHYAPYYIRRIRFQDSDPLIDIMNRPG